MKFEDNIDYSKDWLLKQIIETDFEEKQTHQIQMVKMKKRDLYNLILKFIKINERGN